MMEKHMRVRGAADRNEPVRNRRERQRKLQGKGGDYKPPDYCNQHDYI